MKKSKRQVNAVPGRKPPERSAGVRPSPSHPNQVFRMPKSKTAPNGLADLSRLPPTDENDEDKIIDVRGPSEACRRIEACLRSKNGKKA